MSRALVGRMECTLSSHMDTRARVIVVNMYACCDRVRGKEVCGFFWSDDLSRTHLVCVQNANTNARIVARCEPIIFANHFTQLGS